MIGTIVIVLSVEYSNVSAKGAGLHVMITLSNYYILDMT